MDAQATSGDWPRLARYIEQRQNELGRTQLEIQERGGPSPTKLRDLMSGRSAVLTASKRRDLERALDWQTGSVDAILTGGEPKPIQRQVLTAEEVLANQSDATLAREMQRRGWRVVPADEPERGWHDRRDAPPI
jgi:hypothetical protein